MVSNIFLCAYWPSVCFLWENVYSHLLPIFDLGSILKEISPGCSLEGLMLKLKPQYFGHLMQRVDSLEKTLMLGKIEGRKRRGQQRIDGWRASLTQWAWVWVYSRSWWWTGRPGVLRFMESQRVRHEWATELNWTETHSVDGCQSHLHDFASIS